MPFTRWITPTNVPKRFTTQMYLYFLPLEVSDLPVGQHAVIPMPTDDGGVEHTEAKFAECAEWLERATRNDIILFPPQFYLLSLLAPFLGRGKLEREVLEKQREDIRRFLHTDGDGRGILWGEKVMSPIGLQFAKDGRSVIGLDKPGLELSGRGRGGDHERVMLVNFKKEGPRDVEVRRRVDVLDERREKL